LHSAKKWPRKGTKDKCWGVPEKERETSAAIVQVRISIMLSSKTPRVDILRTRDQAVKNSKREIT